MGSERGGPLPSLKSSGQEAWEFWSEPVWACSHNPGCEHQEALRKVSMVPKRRLGFLTCVPSGF